MTDSLEEGVRLTPASYSYGVGEISDRKHSDQGTAVVIGQEKRTIYIEPIEEPDREPAAMPEAPLEPVAPEEAPTK